MFNVPEQQTGKLANRRAADLRMITEIIRNIPPDISTDSINAYRLGKRGNLDKPVPLKIVLRSRDYVFEVLKNKRKVRDAYLNISITTDKTAMQREQLKKTLGSLRKQPNGLSRDDGKRPDGMTLVPWNKGQPLVWDVTVVDTLADSYVLKTSEVSGFAAEMACKRKHNKYRSIISSNYIFKGLAFETLGPWCKETIDFINVIGDRLIAESGDSKSKKFLFERISLAIQRGNAASIRGTFPDSALLSEIFAFSDVEESAALAVNELLPVKSRKKYDKAYQQFEDWCREKRVRDITEEVLLAYFEQKSRKLKDSTLWSLFSMLKSTIQLKKNVEIKKYASLITFIKRKSTGQVSKKSNIFTKQEIEKFLREADNGTYLMMKVMLIIGISGACRREKLTFLDVKNITDKGSYTSIIIQIPDTKTNVRRESTISPGNFEEYVYPTEQVQLRDRRIAREKKYIQKTLPKDVKRMFILKILTFETLKEFRLRATPFGISTINSMGQELKKTTLDFFQILNVCLAI
ncbi:hypothetical protein GEV33_012782 [Tenebrio molitor]|uniref:Uncharacterized protein n=1 Tax=Tenebrio molitor TaxID=7067 RepID=A0A8J6L376_TENMO|nr:hypothetical protein GEV33_012782 [Tenebrio molitor]